MHFVRKRVEIEQHFQIRQTQGIILMNRSYGSLSLEQKLVLEKRLTNLIPPS